ncbi:chloramphenicol phosphotransferase CPT family protein [Chitiniphilus purpureus]|uniref:Chloramphenicol phosphotransferase CPT family protein n=1 Tax=Chitiniphilus purpureus TaxID=2981137 RepID=A0ABY6DMS8_9NEIS|nr:chloramphenicol phosphotransferase CPT family protein [Chitiniphilus sp. CD1]UXY15659.1 chloramphenicol phosphotransferase CPT family protein [Chitiniphilus sp. CD1]
MPAADGLSMALPQVIVLNGTSSSGKSALARALQEQLPEQFINFSIDSVLYGLPASDLARMQRGEPIDRAGYSWTALVRGYHYALPSLLQAGLKLIVDNAWCEAEETQELLTELAGYPVTLVAVHCDAAILAAREAARGDRAPGLSAWELPRVHAWMDYDLQIDTSTISADDAAAQLVAQLVDGPPTSGAAATLVRLQQRG